MKKLCLPKSELDLRRTIEALRGPLPDELWTRLVEVGHVGACLDRSQDREDFDANFALLLDTIDVVRPFLHRSVGPSRKPEPRKTPPDSALAATIELQVAEASQSEDVRYLWDTLFLGEQPAEGETKAAFLQRIAERWRTIDEQIGYSELAYYVALLGDKLSQQYGWEIASADDFLFYRHKPHLSVIQIKENWNAKFPLASTVTLTVNVTLTPEEVARFYLWSQRDLMHQHGLARSSDYRRRPQSEKHRQLAIFAASRQNVKGKEAMAEWNALHPEWQYKTVQNFQRDRQAALRRLFGNGATNEQEA